MVYLSPTLSTVLAGPPVRQERTLSETVMRRGDSVQEDFSIVKRCDAPR
jgi:hypothetical protein